MPAPSLLSVQIPQGTLAAALKDYDKACAQVDLESADCDDEPDFFTGDEQYALYE